MALATLADVQQRLGIPAATDASLQAALDAAEAAILIATGYTLTAGSVTDTFYQVRIGELLYTSKRPVTGLTARARSIGDTAWTSVSVDVIDAQRGQIALPGETVWPPQAQPAPHFRWREWEWDVLECTYTATALSPVPAELHEACVSLTIYWYQLSQAGAAASEGIGGLTGSYRDWTWPPEVEALLASHMRPRTRYG